MNTLKVFIQRSGDGHFMKHETEWVKGMEQALAFSNSTPAIDFCVENSFKEVKLYFSFENPEYDFLMDIFRAQTPALIREAKDLNERAGKLLRELDQVGAGLKEQKKKIGFKRKRVAQDGPAE